MSEHVAHHRRRKQIWHFVLRALKIDRRVHWMASTRDEAETIRAVFPAARIYVSPEVSQHAGLEFVPRLPTGVLELLFLGRLARRKGLLEAVQMIAQMERPVRLTIAGPTLDEAYLEEVRRAVEGLPRHAKVRWRGLVGRDEVSELIRGSDALISPTTGENFGHSIAESLALGRPAIVTPTTPWNHGSKSGAVVFIDRDSIMESARVLDAFASVDWQTAIERQYAAYVVGSKGLEDGLTLDEVVKELMIHSTTDQ